MPIDMVSDLGARAAKCVEMGGGTYGNATWTCGNATYAATRGTCLAIYPGICLECRAAATGWAARGMTAPHTVLASVSVTPMIGSAPTKEATEREEAKEREETATGLRTRDRASTTFYAKSESVIAMMIVAPLPQAGVSAVPTEMATEAVIARMSGDMGGDTAKDEAGCRWGAPPPYPPNA